MYDYARAAGVEGAVEWHVNFADPRLFTAYGLGLFAQDEMQVAEHPALGALREALHARRRSGTLPAKPARRPRRSLGGSTSTSGLCPRPQAIANE